MSQASHTRTFSSNSKINQILFLKYKFNDLVKLTFKLNNMIARLIKNTWEFRV